MFGEPGRGKTVAVRLVLNEVPAGWKVTWVPVPVRPSVADVRRAVFDVLPLPGRLPHTSARAGATVARVLVADGAQRLPVPCLKYPQSLWHHPGTRITLVLLGPGSERALTRLPHLVGRIVAWQVVPRLAGAEVATVVTGFHPLWRTVPAPDLKWIDQSCTRGTFRTWAAWTAHLQNAPLTTADASVDRALAVATVQAGRAAMVNGALLQRSRRSHAFSLGRYTTSHRARRTRMQDEGAVRAGAVRAGGGLPAASRTALRGPAVRLLLALRAGKELSAAPVRVAVNALGCRSAQCGAGWPQVRNDEAAAAAPGARSRAGTRFTMTSEVRGLLALWNGERVGGPSRTGSPRGPAVSAWRRTVVDDPAPGDPS
ncbi:ATP-binding protein [Streptomyces sp. NPDC007027]|uniref:ATP-binding protein n=1 Tax=Streptomyces sp. NPDC007027 TaxID=3157086 RepID=UPI003455EC31